MKRANPFISTLFIGNGNFNDVDEFDQCLHFLSEINFLPQNEDPQSVYAAINAMKGIKNCICMLIPEVILAACTCIGYKYNEAKQCLVRR